MKKLLYFLAIPFIGLGIMAFAQENLKVVYKENFLANKNLEKPSMEVIEITPKIKKEKLILDTLMEENVSQIDSSKFTYYLGVRPTKGTMDSFKVVVNNRFLVEGKDFIVKNNTIYLDKKLGGGRISFHIYSTALGSMLFPELAKLEEISLPNLKFLSKLPVFVANKESSIFAYNSKLPKLPTSFSKISRNQDTLRTILETNKLGKNPLVIINGEEYPSSILNRIDPTKIGWSLIAKPNDPKYILKYGEKAKDGFMEIRTTDDFIFKNEKTYQIAVENVKKQLEPYNGERVRRLILKDADGKEVQQIGIFDKETKKFKIAFSYPLSEEKKVAFILDGELVSEDYINKIDKPLYFTSDIAQKKILKQKYEKELKDVDVQFWLKTKRE